MSFKEIQKALNKINKSLDAKKTLLTERQAASYLNAVSYICFRAYEQKMGTPKIKVAITEIDKTMQKIRQNINPTERKIIRFLGFAHGISSLLNKPISFGETPKNLGSLLVYNAIHWGELQIY